MTLTLCHTLCWNHYEERSGEHDDDSKRSQQNIGSEYAAQAKASWGKTDAYKEFERKAAGRTKEEDQKLGIEMMDIFREFGEIRDHKPDSTEAIKWNGNEGALWIKHYHIMKIMQKHS